MSEPIALIDMDGTLCDFDGAMLRDLAAIQSPHEPPLPPDIFNDDGQDRAWLKARRRMIKCIPGWWFNLKPLKVGMEVLDQLRLVGFEIHILTKGPKVPSEAWGEKARWVRHHLPEEVKITITQDKGLVYGKVLADDWPPYIQRWLEWRPRGLVLMPDQPWNRDFKHPNVVRVKEGDAFPMGMGPCNSPLHKLLLKIKSRGDGEGWLP